ncbi:hypothetical protein DICPUDRAFT_159574, partial [Dictyostelium purpureum]
SLLYPIVWNNASSTSVFDKLASSGIPNSSNNLGPTSPICAIIVMKSLSSNIYIKSTL